MRFACHSVDASFFDAAPMRFRNIVDLDTTPAEVFAIFDDASSWPKWFAGMHKVAWTSGEPHGVSATRTVWMAPLLTLDERFFRWEPGRRISFFLTGHSQPLAHALAEDYLLEETAPGKTRFTYTVAMEPRLLVRMAGPVSRAYFGSMFRNACQGLQRYVTDAH